MAHRWVRQVLVFAVIGCTAAPLLAQDCSEDAATVLSNAQSKFDHINFPGVLDILKACQQARWPEWGRNNRVEALRLMAITYYFIREETVARATVTDLLKADSGYDLRKEDPVFFEKMVEAEKKKRKAGWIKKLLFGGGATALISFLVLRPAKLKPLPAPDISLPPR